jgi:hypothetical protein
VDALADGTMPADIIKPKLHALEVERIELTKKQERLGEDSTLVTFHPNAVNHYLRAIDTLHKVLSEGGTLDDFAESRADFRTAIGGVKVYPVPRSAPYELELFAHTDAFGANPMPLAVRAVHQIIEEEGIPNFPTGKEGKRSLPQPNSLVSLGRWRAAA